MQRLAAAADVLLPTLSAPACLQLMGAAAALGRPPPPRLLSAMLQHVSDLRWTPADAASGAALLAAMRVRPPAALLASWFSTMTAAAAHEQQLPPVMLTRVLWACCQWRLQPPAAWLHAVLVGLPGRLVVLHRAMSPATLSAFCHCLWQLGVEPSPAFVSAVVAYAQSSILLAGRDDESNCCWDAESLSVLCLCLSLWGYHSSSQGGGAAAALWRAAVTKQAALLLPEADAASLLRLGMYLSGARYIDDEEDNEDEDDAWQEPFVRRALQLLPDARKDEDDIDGVDNNYNNDDDDDAPMHVGALSLLYAGVLDALPVVSPALLEGMLMAARADAAAATTTTNTRPLLLLKPWDLLVLCTAAMELSATTAAAAEDEDEDARPLRPAAAAQLRAVAALHKETACELLATAAARCDSGTPSAVIAAVPVAAASLGMDAALATAVQLEDMLRDAHAAALSREAGLSAAIALARESGATVLPFAATDGLHELAAEEGLQAAADYMVDARRAALLRRYRMHCGVLRPAWLAQALIHY